MNIPLLCRVCQHDLEIHRGACGHRDCSCLTFLPYEGVPGEEILESWQEATMLAVLDLVMLEKEGVVCVDTRDGKSCRVKITYVPEMGAEVSINSDGGKA